jgi:hypothetical protein
MSTKETLSKEFELLKEDLIKLYQAKGMKASGKFEESLRIEVGYDYAILFGEDYAQQLETGRNAGTFPPIKAIEQWILDKGVFNSVLNEIKLSSLAFLIARKIANEGWKREGYGGVELISSIVTEDRWQKIINEVGEVLAIRYSSEIVTLINQLEVA